MNKSILAVLGVVIVVLGFLGMSALFTVDQTEQAIVFQFGKPVRIIRDPGLNVKLPLLQNVVLYDKRVLNLDPPGEEVILSDQKRIDVDAFARYRIIDPLLFYQTVRTESEIVNRIGGLLNSGVRTELGRVPLAALLSEQRDTIMAAIRTQVNEAGKAFGIEVVDVRIGRADLPEQISRTVFDRMRSERVREANLLRAEGEQRKQSIVADADREATIILADANRESRERRGHGDGERNRITTQAFGQDLDFYRFYRSMILYRESFKPDDTNMILSPDSEFLRFFGSSSGKPEKK
jgi:membrane protease subunit HflC